MIGKRILQFQPLHNQLRRSTFHNGVRVPVNSVRPLYLTKHGCLYPLRTEIPFSTIIRPALHTLDDYHPEQPSKRDPTMETTLNAADELEGLLQADGFKTWGFVVYRCTYQSNSDWEKFMTLFLRHVVWKLKFYSGLDLLDNFAPTVFEDPSFERATTAVLRDHFREWAATAIHREQGVPRGVELHTRSGRYRFFVMVDQDALESVLNAPEPDYCDSSFVRLVNGEWEPRVLDDEELTEYTVPPEESEPLEGCTLEDVGWMKVPHHEAEFHGFVSMRDSDR